MAESQTPENAQTSLQTFDSDDTPFLEWMQRNPQGFVINPERRFASRYTMYHRAGCHHISTYGAGHPEGGFTQRQYIKVCTNNLQELLTWRAQHRSRADDIYCQTCEGQDGFQGG